MKRQTRTKGVASRRKTSSVAAKTVARTSQSSKQVSQTNLTGTKNGMNRVETTFIKAISRNTRAYLEEELQKYNGLKITVAH